ncbi:putative TonB-dependent outer membrane receptor protein [Microscilla marina ATCC 23134]|uniref:Putative TonB-dependent outer membrane receptor protein n=1 Tax=Microscilla marina ATCC 23134 TaxID=313606 RepID=A1ZRS3_MICM2|nr:putative TonB-dependent outer membrane receptor protein [Microscilla marina ATCC 23134]
MVAQSTVKVSGYVKDASTGEDLIGATVQIAGTTQGVITNAYGFYSIDLPLDSIKLVFSYVGYTSVIRSLQLSQSLVLNINLPPQQKQLDEIVVKANGLREKLNSTQMGVEKLTAQELKTIPVIFGELDIIKALQLKPGVSSGGEASSGLFVRGGGPDQNLVLLDEAQIYNAAHLFGFFSIFNPDVVKAVDLYKGDFPAQFGGRLSSVLDVKMRDGNKRKFSAAGGIGLISSRLTLEGPIQKDKSSFLIAGRRTYFDVFTRAINRANEDNEDFNPIPDYYFYDLNAKVNYELGKKDRLFLSGYLGRDVFGFKDDNFDFSFKWGNTAAALRWNHVFNSGLFSNTTLSYTTYEYEIANTFDIFNFSLGANIQDYSAKVDFDYLPNNQHVIRFGAHYTYHDFTLGRLRAGSSDGSVDFGSETRLNGNEAAIFITDDYTINDHWRINMGLRLSGFENQGETYGGFEPRFSVRYKLNPTVSLKASAARMYQYVHLVSNSGASLPTDIWYPSTKLVNPQRSDQVALGGSILLFDGKLLISNEMYYKDMDNQLDLKDGAQIFANPNLEDEFVFGRGWSYGNEVYIEKKEGRTTGWIGYTLSWTYRKFGASNGNLPINGGAPFFPRYDRRHDISVVISHKFNERLTFTVAWVYYTGNAISLPPGRFFLQDVVGGNPTVVPRFQQRNDLRMPNYHRLDLGLVWKFFPRWGESDLTFSIYNAYNRLNPYFIFFEEIKDANTNQTLGFQAKQVSLFPVIPSITYNFKF